MERKDWPVRKFESFEEAEAADREQYAGLTPSQRVELVWELTKTVWAFKGDPVNERRLPRHAWPTRRRKG